MKTYSVVFTPRAKHQLENLFGYIAAHSNEDRADKYVSGIVADCVALATFPERGTRRDEIRQNLRTIGYDRRITIAFSVDETRESVAIHGVFYGGQDFEAVLRDGQGND